jgi:phosphatidylglycerol lysyltransferase
VRLIAILTALMGVLNVLSVIRPELLTHLTLITRYAPVAIGQNGAITAILTGFALLILAYGLWRHKQMAWLLTLLVLAVSVITHLLKQSYTEAVLALLLIVYLIAQRSHFHALSDEPSVWQGVRVLAAALGFTLFYGVTGFYVLAQVSDTPFNLGDAWQTTLRFFTISEEPGLFQLNTPFDYLAGSIYVVGAVTFGFALFMLLRPVLVRAPASEQERQQARKIVARYGRSPLAHLMLLPGKSYFFSTDGSVVAFSLFQRTAVALGDPVGPPEDAEAVIRQFLAYCRRRDWRSVFYRTRPDSLPLYHEAALQSIHIGQELVVDLQAWEFHAANLAEWQTAVQRPPHSHELVERLRLVSDAWLSGQQQEESRFAHGWFSRSYINAGVLITLSVPGEDLLAFVHLLPTQEGEIAVSLIRYREQLSASAHSCLLATAVGWAKTEGAARLNLGLWPLPNPQRDERVALDRMAHMIYTAVEPPVLKINARDLAQTYPLLTSPRYLIYPSSSSLPANSASPV